MKLKPATTGSIVLTLAAMLFTFILLSWNFKQSPHRYYQDKPVNDTIPKEKGKEKKIHDLDDVMDQLDKAELKLNMEKVQKEIEDAMKNIDQAKIKMEIDKAMREVDMEKVKKEIDKAMKEVDMEKIKAQVDDAVAKVDWDKIKAELDDVKKINTEKLQEQMKEVEKQMEKIKPQIEEEMKKAKGQIEKAKAEMQEYKDFLNGLEKDGLINQKEDYKIEHRNKELIINGKKASQEIYDKYKSFLEKHKNFTIKKNDDDFDINTDRHLA